MVQNSKKIIVIGGPTASGKSDLAVSLALWIKKNRKKFGVSGAEIISADSRQVYKGFDIGSGKITKEETRGVRHWMLDIASPKRTFTAHDYMIAGNRALKEIFKNNNVPVICGGTGFYIDSLIYSPFIPEVPPQRELREELERLSVEELYLRLEKIDKRRAENIDIKNKRRLIRAVEVTETLGGPIPETGKTLMYPTLIMGVKTDKDELKNKIHKRLVKRINAGMIDEVLNLHRKKGVSWKRLEELGLEYRWTARYLRGKTDLEEMKKNLEKEIIHYAKRQVTWFKREKGIIWTENFREAKKETKDFFRV